MRPLTGDGRLWKGANLAEIQAFAGDDFLFAEAGRVWVRNAAGPWELVVGDGLFREKPDAPLIVFSADAVARSWEPAA